MQVFSSQDRETDLETTRDEGTLLRGGNCPLHYFVVVAMEYIYLPFLFSFFSIFSILHFIFYFFGLQIRLLIIV